MSKKEQQRAEVMALLRAGTLSQAQAAELLGLSIRQVQRLYKSFKQHGISGMISKKRGQASNNRLDKDLVDRVVGRIRERYPDFGPTLAHEKLTEEDGYRISLSSVRTIMIERKIWFPKKVKGGRIHPRRERRSQFGELVQVDGSYHDWFEGRAPKCCLLVFIDDATSTLSGLRFVEAESTFGYFSLFESYLKEYGRPLAVYSDKHSIFRVNMGSDIDSRETEFGRAMKDLGIKTICAHSPEAKGRVERANGTLQDRLVKEMRLQGISNIEDANAFLPKFRKDFNNRFAIAPQNTTDAHRPLNRSHDLERIFSIHKTRQVSKSLSFTLDNTYYQILAEGQTAKQLIGQKVEIAVTLQGTKRVFHKDKELTFTKSDLVRSRPKTLDSKNLTPEAERWVNKKEHYTPSKDHPFKTRKIS